MITIISDRINTNTGIYWELKNLKQGKNLYPWNRKKWTYLQIKNIFLFLLSLWKFYKINFIILMVLLLPNPSPLSFATNVVSSFYIFTIYHIHFLLFIYTLTGDFIEIVKAQAATPKRKLILLFQHLSLGNMFISRTGTSCPLPCLRKNLACLCLSRFHVVCLNYCYEGHLLLGKT